MKKGKEEPSEPKEYPQKQKLNYGPHHGSILNKDPSSGLFPFNNFFPQKTKKTNTNMIELISQSI